MDFGAPVAAGTNPPNLAQTTQTLSGLIGLKQQQQSLQLGAAQVQQQQQTAQQRSAIAGIDWSKYDDGTGTVSTDKMLGDKDLQSRAGDQFPDLLQKAAQIRSAQTQNKQLIANLSGTQREQFGSVVGALRTDPDVIADNTAGRQKVADSIAQFGQQSPEAAQVAQTYGQVAVHAPQGQLARGVNAIQLQAMDASRQAGAQAPNYLATGGGFQQTNPQAAGGSMGSAQPIQATLPPTTGTMGSDGTQGVIGAPKADFTGLKGPGRGPALAEIAASSEDPDVRREAANVNAGRPQGFVPQSLPAGQALNIQNNVEEMNRHFAGLQDSASGAQLQQGLIGNIKSLASGAATGTGAGRKAFVSGLLSALHIPGTGDEAKDTDLLEKNMAQLNMSTPASTDAMRTIVSAARPHGTMQESAIVEAADQLGGQIQANVAMRNALQGYKMFGDVQGYQTARTKLESVADPRAWQYVNLGPGTPEAKAFLQKLTPADRSSLIDKTGQLEQMGLLK